ncbi:MAG: hypothetical protein ACK4YP_06295 [Myxococcota bacterium]
MKSSLAPLLLAALAATVAPEAAWARHGHDRGPGHGPPVGRVLVTNHSGGAVTVTIGGGGTREIAAWQTVDLPVAAGETTLRATYRQFGAERLLQSDRLYVTPGRTTGVTLAPEDDARVLVHNDSPFYAQLFLDGRPDASFAPGEARVVTTDVGRADLSLVANGRTLERQVLELRAFEERRWIVSPPRLGTLVVSNPHPIDVKLVAENGIVRTVPAYGTATFADLPPGELDVTARRATGEYIDREEAQIRPGATTAWRIDAPRTGFLTLDSDHYLGVDVKIDERRMTSISPDEVERLELSVGWHEVEVRDERGREILDTYIEVKPFEVARASFGRGYHERADRDDHDRDRHRGHDHDDDDSVADNCSMR